MSHLYQPHTKRQRKCRLITKLPITFGEPIKPTAGYLVDHRHPWSTSTATRDQGAFPQIAHNAEQTVSSQSYN
ncbi:MAG TPA: hypothetical protein VFQ54_12720 [Thermomicrobiales bacterium]|nr:hypothetical protein [Thermomicrobiales bacterium]